MKVNTKVNNTSAYNMNEDGSKRKERQEHKKFREMRRNRKNQWQSVD